MIWTLFLLLSVFMCTFCFKTFVIFFLAISDILVVTWLSTCYEFQYLILIKWKLFPCSVLHVRRVLVYITNTLIYFSMEHADGQVSEDVQTQGAGLGGRHQPWTVYHGLWTGQGQSVGHQVRGPGQGRPGVESTGTHNDIHDLEQLVNKRFLSWIIITFVRYVLEIMSLK